MIKSQISDALKNKCCQNHVCDNDDQECKECVSNKKNDNCRKLLSMIEISKHYLKYLDQQKKMANVEGKHNDLCESKEIDHDLSDKTINGVVIVLNDFVDMFNTMDCKWYKAKIIYLSKVDKILKCQLIFENKQEEQAIHYGREWWKIAKYRTKTNINNDDMPNTLSMTKYFQNNVDKKDIIISGYIKVKKESNKEYEEKYFEIKEQSQYLCCYDNHKNQQECVDQIDLTKTNITLSRNSDTKDEYPLSFKMIKSETKSNDTEVIYFKCLSMDDYVDWVSVLQYFKLHGITSYSVCAIKICFDHTTFE